LSRRKRYGVFFVKKKKHSRRDAVSVRLLWWFFPFAMLREGVDSDGLSAPSNSAVAKPVVIHTLGPRRLSSVRRGGFEGNHTAGAKSLRHNLVFGGSCGPDHDALMRIGG
jgi:hypothetical protein